jgi:hypothetical protein
LRRPVRWSWSWSWSFSAFRLHFTLAGSLQPSQPSGDRPLRDLAGERPCKISCSGLQPLNDRRGKTCGEPVEPWCLPGAGSTGDRYPGRLGSAIQLTMPASSTELSTSFALASKRSCTWLSSLVSSACSSGSVVIHSGVPTLRLMCRSSYLIMNQEIRDRPRQKTSRYPVHPAASKENNQADKLFPHRTRTSPASKLGLFGFAGASQGIGTGGENASLPGSG